MFSNQGPGQGYNPYGGGNYGPPPGAPPGSGYGQPPGAPPGSGYGQPPGAPPGSGYGAPPGAPPGSGYGAPPGSGYGAPPGSGYGAPPGAPQASGYGAPPGSPPGSSYGSPTGVGYGQPPYGGYAVSPDVQQMFQAVDSDGSGRINVQELQAALVSGQGKNFSEGACRMLISMFSRDQSGSINITEFQGLFQYVNNWINVFRAYDKNGSGSIDQNELSAAMQQMGFRFSPQFYQMILTKYDPDNHQHITVDQFIEFSIRVQKVTEFFRAKDLEQKGAVEVGFEECLNMIFDCAP